MMKEKSLSDYLITLKEVEISLNTLSYDDIPIGSLLSKQFSLLYLRKKGIYKYNITRFQFFINTLKLIKAIISGFKVKNQNLDQEKSIFISKLTDRPHSSSLIDPIADYFHNNHSFYIPNNKKSKLGYKPNKISLSVFVKVMYFLFSNLINIFSKLRPLNKSYSKSELLLILYKQLVSISNWNVFFSKGKFKIVVVDFDRDFLTSSIILAAKKNHIKTVTLVHGVLNPPFAYTPIIADEIWCWGAYQKEQLISYKVASKRIKIVGNPIVKKDKSKSPRKPIKTIGFGLNPMPNEENVKFLNNVLSVIEDNKINLIIKLHPAMDKEFWVNRFYTKSITIYNSKEITNKAFFKEIDLLIIGNSGLGFEAVASNIPIWVYRVSPDKTGNDGVMIEDGGAPDISKNNIITKELEALLTVPNYLINLHKIQKEFIEEKLYHAIGDDASKNIINEIKYILNL